MNMARARRACDATSRHRAAPRGWLSARTARALPFGVRSCSGAPSRLYVYISAASDAHKTSFDRQRHARFRVRRHRPHRLAYACAQRRLVRCSHIAYRTRAHRAYLLHRLHAPHNAHLSSEKPAINRQRPRRSGVYRRYQKTGNRRASGVRRATTSAGVERGGGAAWHVGHGGAMASATGGGVRRNRRHAVAWRRQLNNGVSAANGMAAAAAIGRHENERRRSGNRRESRKANRRRQQRNGVIRHGASAAASAALAIAAAQRQLAKMSAKAIKQAISITSR